MTTRFPSPGPHAEIPANPASFDGAARAPVPTALPYPHNFSLDTVSGAGSVPRGVLPPAAPPVWRAPLTGKVDSAPAAARPVSAVPAPAAVTAAGTVPRSVPPPAAVRRAPTKVNGAQAAAPRPPPVTPVPAAAGREAVAAPKPRRPAMYKCGACGEPKRGHYCGVKYHDVAPAAAASTGSSGDSPQ